MADTPVSKTGPERGEGSTPSLGTILVVRLIWHRGGMADAPRSERGLPCGGEGSTPSGATTRYMIPYGINKI